MQPPHKNEASLYLAYFAVRVIPLKPSPDKVELRVYPGATGDFNLYEDEGDNYDYEHGAYTVIPLHWDNRAETLTIGDRRGSFPGALEHRTFRIVLVREGHGTGIAPTSEPDATVDYQGKAASVKVRLQN